MRTTAVKELKTDLPSDQSGSEDSRHRADGRRQQPGVHERNSNLNREVLAISTAIRCYGPRQKHPVGGSQLGCARQAGRITRLGAVILRL
jgi:hypothetical protein